MTIAVTIEPFSLPRFVHGITRIAARINWAEAEVLGLRSVVRPGDHVFDVGAAYGMYTFPLAHIVGPTGSVHSFEPQSRQLRALKVIRRVLRADHVTVSRSAIGDDPGDHTMVRPYRFGVPIYGHTHVGEGTEHALTPQATHTKRWTTPMHTVDSWCALNGIDNVSFIKADVEGFEPHVLKGAVETIERSRPSMLLEIEDRHLGRYGRDANQFADEIRGNWPDYGMYTWSEGEWTRAERVESQSRNYLFATREAFVPYDPATL
jgi:FkbM family methyltransferase